MWLYLLSCWFVWDSVENLEYESKEHADMDYGPLTHKSFLEGFLQLDSAQAPVLCNGENVAPQSLRPRFMSTLVHEIQWITLD